MGKEWYKIDEVRMENEGKWESKRKLTSRNLRKKCINI